MLKLIFVAALICLLSKDGAASSPTTPGTKGRSLRIPKMDQKHLGTAGHPDNKVRSANSPSYRLPRKQWLKPPKVSKKDIRNPPASGTRKMQHQLDYKRYQPKNLNNQLAPNVESFQHNFLPPNVQPDPHYKNLDKPNPFHQVLSRNKVNAVNVDHNKNTFPRVPITPHNRTRPIRWKRYPGRNPYHRQEHNRRRYQRVQHGVIPRKEFWSAPSKHYTPYSKGVKRFPHKRYDPPQEEQESMGTPQDPKLSFQPIGPVRNPYKNKHGDAPKTIKPIPYGPHQTEEVTTEDIPKIGNGKSESQALPEGSLGIVKNVLVNESVYTSPSPVQRVQGRGGNIDDVKKPDQQAETSSENKDESSSPLEEYPDLLATAPDNGEPVQESSTSYEAPKHHTEPQYTSHHGPYESINSTTQTPFWRKGISVIKSLFTKARELSKGTLGVPIHKEEKEAIEETTTPQPPFWRRGVSVIRGILSKARDIAKGAVRLPMLRQRRKNYDDDHPDKPTIPSTQVLQVNAPTTDDLMSQSELVQIQSPWKEEANQYPPIPGKVGPSGEYVQEDQETHIQRRGSPPTVPTLPSTPKPTVKPGILSVFKRLLFF